jgi:hypothetical protein
MGPLYFASVDGVTVIESRALGRTRPAPRAIFESLVTVEGERTIEDEVVLSGPPAGRHSA